MGKCEGCAYDKSQRPEEWCWCTHPKITATGYKQGRSHDHTVEFPEPHWCPLEDE